MVKIVCWNIGRNKLAWDELLRMRDEDGVDVALLQEVGKANRVAMGAAGAIDDVEQWDWEMSGRWPAVAKLSDRVRVEWLRKVAPEKQGSVEQQRNGKGVGQDEIAVSDRRTLAAARITPLTDGKPSGEPFIAASMYARWLGPTVRTGWRSGYPDAAAHRIISDLSIFIGHTDPKSHRILAAGDLNTIYGATADNKLENRSRMLTVFDRMEALGLQLVGPQWPDADRDTDLAPSHLPPDNNNVATYLSAQQRKKLCQNNFLSGNQLDYVFASQGFKMATAHAMNDPANWGPSDHCRILIEGQ